MLGRSAVWLLTSIMSVGIPGLFAKPSLAAKNGSNKVLIVFFSHTGNTREIARQIRQITGGDMVELRPEQPYPTDYNEVVKQAKQELNAGYKPALKTNLVHLESYETILVGSPIWWGTVAPPVQTFLTGNDLSGKTIAPFVTHAGSGLGQSVGDVAKLCPGSKVLGGLTVWGKDVKSAQNDLAAWLRRIGISK